MEVCNLVIKLERKCSSDVLPTKLQSHMGSRVTGYVIVYSPQLTGNQKVACSIPVSDSDFFLSIIILGIESYSKI